jgi:hypothetical protein
MTIEEFEQLTINQLEIESVEYKSFIVGIEKPKGKAEEYNVYLITDEKNYVGVHADPLKAILKAIFQA